MKPRISIIITLLTVIVTRSASALTTPLQGSGFTTNVPGATINAAQSSITNLNIVSANYFYGNGLLLTDVPISSIPGLDETNQWLAAHVNSNAAALALKANAADLGTAAAANVGDFAAATNGVAVNLALRPWGGTPALRLFPDASGTSVLGFPDPATGWGLFADSNTLYLASGLAPGAYWNFFANGNVEFSGTNFSAAFVGNGALLTGLGGGNIAGGSINSNKFDAATLAALSSAATNVSLGGFVLKVPTSTNTILSPAGTNTVLGIVNTWAATGTVANASSVSAGFTNIVTAQIAGFAATGTVASATEAQTALATPILLNGGPATMDVLGHVQGDGAVYAALAGVSVRNNTNLNVAGTNRAAWFAGNGAGLTGINSNSMDAATLALFSATAPGGGADTNGLFAYATNLVNATSNALQTQITGLSTGSGFASAGDVATVWNATGLSTNVNDALRFIASNNITDLTAQRDLIGMQNEFNALGQWSNVVDAVILSQRFGAPRNLLSFKLRAMTQNNVSWTNWGGVFNSNAWINLPGLPDSRTNTLVVVWRPHNPWEHGPGYLAGMVNTNNGNGWWYGLLNYDQERIGYRTGTSNVWSEVPSFGTTNLVILDYGWTYSFDARWRQGQRRLTALSVNGNYVRAWDASSAGESKIDYTNPLLGHTIPDGAITDAVTTLRIGQGVNPVCTQIDKPFTGDIAAVFLLRGPADPNMIRAAFRAADWLDTDTQKNIYVTDSLGLPDTSLAPACGTNSYVWWLQTRPYNSTAKNTYRWYSFSGARTADWNSPHGIDFLFRDGLVGKMTRGRVVWGLGVNDNYAGLFSGATSFSYATNLVYAAKTNGFDSVWNLEADISHTNPIIFTWTTNGYQRWQDFNNLLLTNWYLFSGFIRSDLLIDQQLMSNTNYSPDGVHFHSTNGWLVWPKIAQSWLGDGDYGFRSFTTFSGNINNPGTNYGGVFSGNAAGLTNLPISGIAGQPATNAALQTQIDAHTTAIAGKLNVSAVGAAAYASTNDFDPAGAAAAAVANRLTTNAAAATYYPLSGNPGGFQTSGDVAASLAAYVRTNGDASGVTNYVTWAAPAGTNVNLNFTGVLRVLSITNTAINITNASGTSGSITLFARTNIPITWAGVSNSVTWLTAAPTTITNGVVVFTAAGTNILAAYKEKP